MTLSISSDVLATTLKHASEQMMGIGVLDPVSAEALRDALIAAAIEVHADALMVLTKVPDAVVSLPLGWLRPSRCKDSSDLETHLAVALFWGLFREERHAERVALEISSREKKTKRRCQGNPPRPSTVTVTSAFGLSRRLLPNALAEAITEAIPADIRLRFLVDARPAPGDSGVIHLTSRTHYEYMRERGSLRCVLCGKFVSGGRALWWHQKTRHAVDHSTAVHTALQEHVALSISVYSSKLSDGCRYRDPRHRDTSLNAGDLAEGMKAARLGNAKVLDTLIANGRVEALQDQGLEAARRGDLDTLHELIANGWDPNLATDRHGSSALLWAAGAGQLAACRFLVEQAGVDPITTAQAGRRAYHGRTALHWAARNGHVDIIRYLVSEQGVPVDARTSEGTTAFALACWKGHLNAMRWLAENGKCSPGAVNTFGCNAAMWCVQGEANIDACEYVHSLGVSFRLLNRNGHSAVHKAAQRGRRDICAWLLGWEWRSDQKAARRRGDETWGTSLIDSAHLRADSEGFQPSDLARLADNQSLQEWLQMRQNEVLLLDTVDKHSLRGDHGEGVRVGSVIETMYPPVTFFGAAATGDLHLLKKILTTDPYHANQDNGAGSPLHIAVAYGHVDMVAAMLRGALGTKVHVNAKSRAGNFGLTPLHIAATLFQRKHAVVAAEEVLLSTARELLSICNLSKTCRDDGQSSRRAEKKARKAAHRRADAARKALAITGIGSRDPTRMYRIILQAGGNCRANATIPAASLDVSADLKDRRLINVRPIDLVGPEFMEEVRALELEVAEAPPTYSPCAQAQSSDLDSARCHGSEMHVATLLNQSPRERCQATPEILLAPLIPTSMNPNDPVAVANLFDSGVAEALTSVNPMRIEIPEVPGAFILKGVLGKSTCATLAKIVDKLHVDVFGRDDDAGRNVFAGKAPRRETAASRTLRNHDTFALFSLATEDPLSLLSASDDIDGKPLAPVEPVRWEVPKTALASIGKRCRALLPHHSGSRGHAPHNNALLASPGNEFSSALRCYRYLPGSTSLPHYDKISQSQEAMTFSAYTAVLFLNGDDYEGGATTFFEPVGETCKKSARGTTWAIGSGAVPLFRVSKRVRGETGDMLCFPHGERPGAYPNPLHEGSAVIGKVPKYIIRTDIHFTYAKSGVVSSSELKV